MDVSVTANPKPDVQGRYRLRLQRFHGGGSLVLGGHELQGSYGSLGALSLPRLEMWQDGDDEGNAIYYVGFKIGTKHADPFLSVGLQLTVPVKWYERIERLRRARA